MAQITICTDDSNPFERDESRPWKVVADFKNEEAVRPLMDVLTKNVKQVDERGMVVLGALAYITFEDEAGTLKVARIEIRSGIIQMLHARRVADRVAVDWFGPVTSWKCDEFVKMVVRHLKKRAPKYWEELNAYFVELTQSSIEQHLAKPIRNLK